MWPLQHTHNVIYCTSLRGGFEEWDMLVAYLSWISSCLHSMMLFGSSSSISTNAPDTTLATSFPGIGGRDGQITTGGCTPGVMMAPLGAAEKRGTEWTAVVAAKPNSWIRCRCLGPGSWPRIRSVEKTPVKYSSNTILTDSTMSHWNLHADLYQTYVLPPMHALALVRVHLLRGWHLGVTDKML